MMSSCPTLVLSLKQLFSLQLMDSSSGTLQDHNLISYNFIFSTSSSRTSGHAGHRSQSLAALVRLNGLLINCRTTWVHYLIPRFHKNTARSTSRSLNIVKLDPDARLLVVQHQHALKSRCSPQNESKRVKHHHFAAVDLA